MATDTAADSSIRPSRETDDLREAYAAPTESQDDFADEAELAAAEENEKLKHFVFFTAVPAWLISMVVHIILLVTMALIAVGPDVKQVTAILSVSNSVKEEFDSLEEFEIQEQMDPIEVTNLTVTSPTMQPIAAEIPQEVVTNISAATDLEAAAVSVDLAEFGEQTAPKNDLLKSVGAVAGEGLEGRGSANRAKMVAKFGGTEGSEKAVAMALRWLAEHQMPNGSWNFDHQQGLCRGRCSHPGNLTNSPIGATALALLPFLGAGQTHKEGQYKKNVAAGLIFLVRSMKSNGSLTEPGGSMYSHGLASIVLCEAYAMTHDRQLMAPAQAALNFIVYAQDPVGGGWRYAPRQPGDTSAVGWQLMALKSGHMAYLNVPPSTVQGAIKFLDSMQANGGANYGYTGPGTAPGTTAVGLLCRMYLGWKKDHPGLARGVQFLSKTGPDKENLYYDYYATQVLRHWEGEEWKKWNEEMREFLVASQSKEGHMIGSWSFEGRRDHGFERGGRLYCTAMATMILEVYYRHMPIYANKASEDEFPLK